MSDSDQDRRDLEKAWDESEREADALLAPELAALKRATRSQLDALIPRTTDAHTRERLIAAVEVATQKNEDLAQLQDRLRQCGPAAMKLAKVVVKLLGA